MSYGLGLGTVEAMAIDRRRRGGRLVAVGPGPVTVLTVDDQAVFLRAASRLIAAMPGFEQVGQARSGCEALDLAAELHPDLVLVDVRMPDMDGIETARRLIASNSETVVVLISLEESPDLPSSLGAAGAAAHLRKRDLSSRTLRAVWAARAGPGRRS